MESLLYQFQRDFSRIVANLDVAQPWPSELERLTAPMCEAGIALESFERAVAVLDPKQSAHRVLRGDIAEWLSVSMTDYRRVVAAHENAVHVHRQTGSSVAPAGFMLSRPNTSTTMQRSTSQ